jgi:hypothetical protein
MSPSKDMSPSFFASGNNGKECLLDIWDKLNTQVEELL